MKEVKKSQSQPTNIPSAQTSSSVSLNSDVVFKTIHDRMNENVERARSVNGVFVYNITKDGQIAKKWSKLFYVLSMRFRPCLDSIRLIAFRSYIIQILAIDLKNVKLYEGPPSNINADTTLTVSDDDFVDIALGKINPQVAFMKGKLKIAGNIMLTQKLVPLLKASPKL